MSLDQLTLEYRVLCRY